VSSPSADEIARRLALPRVELFDEVGSTLDVAHERAAAGAPSGTLIVAEMQTAGRGRQGRTWQSERSAGVWLTLIERPTDRPALDVLSLRVGLAIVTALEPLIDEPLGLKWPNDVYRGGRKLAGILVEARWRGEELDWVAIGVGLNVKTPTGQSMAVGLEPTPVSRIDALYAIVPFIRRAAAALGGLLDDELEAFSARDIARGRRITAPVPGMVRGVDASGALVVDATGGPTLVRAGSIVMERDQ
jgi:BirA family transcriptional regulator, biotin operon repressor / biotin---[acetyl-CoA-carboxylase] ligase